MNVAKLRNLLGDDFVSAGQPPKPAELDWDRLKTQRYIRQPELTAAEQAHVDARNREMDQLLTPVNRPRYRLKFTLLGEPTFQNNPLWKGQVGFLTSGRQHSTGGNQVVLYMCPGWEILKNGCSSLLPPEGNKGGTSVCPACGNTWDGEQVWQYCQGVLTPKQWAKRLTHHYQKRLANSADIEVYWHPDPRGLRTATAREQEKVHNGDLLAKVEQADRVRVYPYEDILKDLAAGSLLVDRIYAFLKSL